MRNFIHIFILFFAFNLSAQIHTSGGANDGLHSTSKYGSEQEDLMNDFTSYLNNRNKFCKGSQKLTLGQDFFDIYLRLSAYENESIMNEEMCSKRSIYFKCLKDKEYKKKIKAISLNEDFVPFLRRRYSISQKEAESIIQFFQKLDYKK